MGQNAIYYKGKSYSSGGGGGGTEVIANPEDAATDTLTKLSVDGDVYEIPEINVEDVHVNGTSVLDENSIAQIKSYQEITKAEYDALPSSKLTDDILYCITDGGATEPGEYFNPVIYSTTEREIGVWTDGRPLYEKTYTFKFTDLENKTISSSILSGSYALPHEEYERIWVYDGLIKCVPAVEGGASATSLKGTPLNYSAGSAYTRTNIQRNASFNNSYPFIFIENTYGTSELYKIVNDLDVYVVLRYTKTTDTPGSGKYTTLGVPSTHYSTDEQVIGTWIDGKPLYQKTCSTPLTLNTGSGEKTYTLDISDVNKVISVDYSAGANGLSINVTRTDTPDEIRARINQGNQLLVWSGYDRSTLTIYTTIKYTKTTD